MQSLAELIRAFPNNPTGFGKSMRDLADLDPRQFFADALPSLRTEEADPGRQYVLALLLSREMLLRPLCDRDLFTIEEASAIVKRLVKIDPFFDVRLIRKAFEAHSPDGENGDSASGDIAGGLHLLEILGATSDLRRLLPILGQLQKHPDPRVRSKAVLLMGATNKNAKWVEQSLGESDARIRANAIESLWAVESPEALSVLWAATTDPDNRVAGNAVLGLFRHGQPASIAAILQLARHRLEDFRATAAWVITETADPRFLPMAVDLMRETNPTARKHAFRAVAALKAIENREAASENLVVKLLEAAANARGEHRLRVAVFNEDGQPMDRLSPIRFSLFAGSSLVEDEAIEESSTVEALALGFVLPYGGTPAVSACLTHKAPQDSWAILKFSDDLPAPHQFVSAPRGQTGDVVRLFGVDIVGKKAPGAEVKDAPSSAIWFNKETELVRRAAASTLKDAAGVLEGLGKMLDAAAAPAGRKSILIVDGPTLSAPPNDAIHALATRALNSRITIHAVSHHAASALPDSALSILCALTGGSFSAATGVDDVPRVLAQLCAGLRRHYLLRFSAGKAGQTQPTSLKVVVRTPFGRGSKSISLH